MRRWVWTIVAALAACSPFGVSSGDGPSPGTTPAPGPRDGGSAATDGSAPESGSGNVEGADAFVPPLCPEHTTFCDAFERANPTQGPWTAISETAVAPLAIDSLQHTTLGNSALHESVVALTASSASPGSFLSFHTTLNAPQKITYAFSFFPTTIARKVDLAAMFITGVDTEIVVLGLEGNSLLVGCESDANDPGVGDVGYRNLGQSMTPRAGEWNTVEATMDLSVAPPVLLVLLNGTQVDLGSGKLNALAGPTIATFQLGVDNAWMGAASEYWFDDVTIHVEP